MMSAIPLDEDRREAHIFENALTVPDGYTRVASIILGGVDTICVMGKDVPAMYWCYPCQSWHRLFDDEATH